MASCITSQWVSTAPQVKLTVVESGSTETTAKLAWTLQYIASNAASTTVSKKYSVTINGVRVASGSFNINGKTLTHTIDSGNKTFAKGTASKTISFGCSFDFNLTWSGVYKGTASASGSITIPAKTSYKITYNANGGSGAPSAQTKWYGTDITLSSSKPTRTGFTFLGWGTSSTAMNATYSSGGTYSANASATLYAVWRRLTYTVKYNANGGTGAPNDQTKTYGVALNLSSTVPSKTNYNFLGWGTSANATTVSYDAGSQYTANAAITLYAIWKLAYVKPRIVNVSAVRCESSGTPSNEGTKALVTFDWECDRTVTSIAIKWKTTSSTTWSSTSITASGTSGTVTHVVGVAESADFNTETAYDIQIVVSDNNGSSTAFTRLPSVQFAIDFLSGGTGVSFGKAAEIENTAEFEFDAKFNGPVYGNVYGLNKLPEIPANSNLNNYMTTGCWAVYGNITATTIANIPVPAAGRLLVISSTGEGIRSEQWSYLRQRYIPYSIGNATWERDITRSSNNVWTYGAWTRTSLTPTISDMVYHQQTTLWEGAKYMTADHTITLSKAVSAQPSGIVLTFSKYADGAALENNFNHFFVPKAFVAGHKGYGSGFTMMDINFGQLCHKYLYINDSTITGHANNNATGMGGSGVGYKNNAYVLRYVFGV